MRSALATVMLLTVVALSTGARADERDCADTASDLAGAIACLKDLYKDQRAKCGGAPTAPWKVPVAGQRILDFGEQTRYGASSKGIVYETEQGARARAPVAGTVLFAGQFRSYGNLIILDACGFDVLLSGLAALSVRDGDNVEATAELGRLPGDSSRGPPLLYFEVRSGGRPVDPNAFLK